MGLITLLAPTIEDAFRNRVTSMEIAAARFNRDLEFNWRNYFEKTFLVELNNCSIAADAQPLAPPKSWVVVGRLEDELDQVTEAKLNAVGIEQKGPAVCAVPEFHAPRVTPSSAQGPGAIGGSMAIPVPTGDVMPVGYIAMATDGSRWQKTESATPFGRVTFYARIG